MNKIHKKIRKTIKAKRLFHLVSRFLFQRLENFIFHPRPVAFSLRLVTQSSRERKFRIDFSLFAVWEGKAPRATLRPFSLRI